jgi:hypothetical protein
MAFDNAQIDMPCERVHDQVWCSPFALGIGDRPSSKKTTAISSPERPLDGQFGIQWASGVSKAALVECGGRTIESRT